MAAKRVLLVEDDWQNAHLVSFMLKERGYDVTVAGDGREAVASVSAELPDLVLMDMMLPKMDGYAATRAIKAMPHAADLPIVALTACIMPGDMERTFAAGCCGCISKPVNTDTFVTEVEKYIA